MNNWYRIYNANKQGIVEIDILDEIGLFGITAKEFKRDFDAKVTDKTKAINININSPGGSVSDGLTIYNILAQSDVTVNVYVMGVAFSIAGVIAMAGDSRRIAESAFFMVHNPMMLVAGNASELRKAAEVLDKFGGSLAGIYAKVTGKDVSEIQQLMDDETFFTGDESVDEGFFDATVEAQQVAARFEESKLRKFGRVPDAVLAQYCEPNTAEHDGTGDVNASDDNEVGQTPQEKEESQTMTQSNGDGQASPQDSPKAATYQELKAEFPEAGSDFICHCMDNNLTVHSALKAYAKHADERAKKQVEEAKAEAQKQVEEAKAQATATATSGTDGVPYGDGDSSADSDTDAETEVESRVQTLMHATKRDRHIAFQEVMRGDPDLRARYVDEHAKKHANEIERRRTASRG